MLLPNKKRRVNIYIYIFKILPDHYHLHYYYRIIHQKKKINNIKATLIRIIHHTYID